MEGMATLNGLATGSPHWHVELMLCKASGWPIDVVRAMPIREIYRALGWYGGMAQAQVERGNG